MFVLLLLWDTIHIPSALLGMPREDAIAVALNSRYQNRVVKNIGLGILLREIVYSGPSVRFCLGMVKLRGSIPGDCTHHVIPLSEVAVMSLLYCQGAVDMICVDVVRRV